MDDEEKNEMLTKLVERKRKLMELREEIKLKSSRQQIDGVGTDKGSEQSPTIREQELITLPLAPNKTSENDVQNLLQGESNPRTPYSIQAPSISPPPYSPLTPLAVQTKPMSQNMDDTELLANNNDPASSPLQPMSPETQTLYNQLSGREFSEISDTDDSLLDPDFNLPRPKQRIVFESDPESDSSHNMEYSTLIHNIKEPEITNSDPAANETDPQSKLPLQNTTCNNNTNLELHEDVTSLVYDNTQNALRSTTDDNNEDSIRADETQNFSVEVNTDDTEIENAEIENQNANGINTETDQTEKRTTKKTTRKARKESKELRNFGKSYVSVRGLVIPERKSKELKSSCRLKCAERFSVDEQKECFQNYWNLGQRERRAAFVSKSVTILPKKTQTTASHSKNRDCYCVYKLQICNEERPICKDCFCKLLGETVGFVNVVIQKKKESTTGIIDIDLRGKNTPINKKSIEDLTLVKDHILSFPSYESHYCRKSTGKKYLSPDLSIAKMYREYKLTTSTPVSLKLYSRGFHELKLSFKQPSKDTCNTCDVFQAKIKVADENNKIQLIAELAEHQAQAEKAYFEKRVDKDTVKSDSSVRAFAFDLQQCLPTPYLKTSVSFYKRQLWSFNLTIHDLSNNEASCYMWDETIGARGSNQIASCLWHFCKSLPSDVIEIIFYSDTCGGQNKNNTVAMMFMYLLNNHPTLQTIHHKFLLSGHTHMECDSDHAIIEKVKKRTQMKINHLNDWIQLVRTCKVLKPFKVVAMTLKDFFDFTELRTKKGPFSLKKQNEQGEAFLWQPIKWLKYNKDSIGKILFKHNLDRETPFKSVNIKKRGKITADSFKLTQISTHPLPISAEKKKDLLDLIQLIDEPFREFYSNIKTTNCVSTDPDLDVDNPDTEDSCI